MNWPHELAWRSLFEHTEVLENRVCWHSALGSQSLRQHEQAPSPHLSADCSGVAPVRLQSSAGPLSFTHESTYGVECQSTPSSPHLPGLRSGTNCRHRLPGVQLTGGTSLGSSWHGSHKSLWMGRLEASGSEVTVLSSHRSTSMGIAN